MNQENRYAVHMDELVVVRRNDRLKPKRPTALTKGDYPGHPFRGNQWTKGRGSAPQQESSVRSFPNEIEAYWGSSDLQANYTDEQRKTHDYYKQYGYGFINDSLRGVKYEESDAEHRDYLGVPKRPSQEQLAKHIEGMDKNFEYSAVACDKTMTLHRGMVDYDATKTGSRGAFESRYATSEDLQGSWVSQLKVGQVITDNGFASTSISKETATGFSSSDSFVGVMFVIKAKKGTRVMAGAENESELILNRGTQMKVKKVSAVNAGTHDIEVQLEVL